MTEPNPFRPKLFLYFTSEQLPCLIPLVPMLCHRGQLMGRFRLLDRSGVYHMLIISRTWPNPACSLVSMLQVPQEFKSIGCSSHSMTCMCLKLIYIYTTWCLSHCSFKGYFIVHKCFSITCCFDHKNMSKSHYLSKRC